MNNHEHFYKLQHKTYDISKSLNDLSLIAGLPGFLSAWGAAAVFSSIILDKITTYDSEMSSKTVIQMNQYLNNSEYPISYEEYNVLIKDMNERHEIVSNIAAIKLNELVRKFDLFGRAGLAQLKIMHAESIIHYSLYESEKWVTESILNNLKNSNCQK